MINISSLPRDQKLRIVLREIVAHNGVAKMSEIYRAIEDHLDGSRLSYQDRASLRELVNRYAVKKEKVPGTTVVPGTFLFLHGREESGAPLEIYRYAKKARH